MGHSDMDGTYPGDAYAAADPPTYPENWTAQQRVGAYWYAHSRGIKPRTTEAWNAVLAGAQRTANRHHDRIGKAGA
jgi:hypothetical protein